MLRSTETCLSADDIAIRCTVRHRPKSSSSNNNANSNSSGEVAVAVEDMMCTMRIWHKTKQPKSSSTRGSSHGPPGGAGQQHLSSFELSPGRNGRQKDRGSLTGFDNSPLIASAKAAAAKTDLGTSAGPELILDPISTGMVEQQHTLCCADSFGDTPRLLSQKFTASFEAPVRRYSLSTNQSPTRRIGNVTIPLKEIVMIDVHGNIDRSSNGSPSDDGRASQTISATTLSSGAYEFTMDSVNGREILLAFLKANLPKERINDNQDIPRSPSNLTLNTSQSNRSYDVEAFTATRMSERLKSESIGEKVQRRVGRLVSSFEELSCAITECAPCGAGHAAVSPAPQTDVNSYKMMEKRDSPPNNHGGHHVEMAPAETPRRSRPSVAFKDRPTPEVDSKRPDLLKHINFPSGLSVESDPDRE